MEPKIIKEESVERDSSVLDEPSALNNNNNKESAFRIHTRKSKIKSAKDAGFSSTSTSDSSGEHLLSPTQPVPIQHDVESESSSPPSDTFRNHSKLKRFLTTLVQFSGQVSPQTSERVKGQIFTLVSNLISVEEFHHNIQEMTNFPLRPFVLPFLRSHLPSLQRDLLTMARNNKQTLNQFLKQHENAYLDRDSQPSEPSEIFHQVDRPAAAPRDIGGGGGGNKRPYPLSAAMTVAESYYEAAGGYAADLDGYQQPCAKRPNLGYGIPFMYHHHQQHLLHHPGLATEPPPPPTVSLQPPPPPPPPPPSQHGAPSHPYNMLPLLHIRETEDHKGHVEDEWKNIHVMLNCILSMVEKTKKALGILQERGMTDSNFPDWNRKKSTEEVLAQTVRHTEERIESIKKKAEDSMNEIRHQAMVELQKLVLAAENKIIDLVAAERTKINGNRTSGACTVGLHRTSPPLIPQYNSCWNCGRKANETCSGCNAAQYCGSFCQHKDWETHHQTCCAARSAAASPVGKKPPQQPPPTVSAGIVAAPSAAAASPSVDVADDLSTNRPDACITAAAASDPGAAATSAADKVQPYGNKQQQQQLLSLQQSSNNNNNNNNNSSTSAAAGKHR